MTEENVAIGESSEINKVGISVGSLSLVQNGSQFLFPPSSSPRKGKAMPTYLEAPVKTFVEPIKGQATAVSSNVFFHPLPISFENLNDGRTPNADEVGIKKPTTYKGMPCIYLTNDELEILSKPFEFTLIGKFVNGRPQWYMVNRYFSKLKLSRTFKIAKYDGSHFLVHLSNPDDYAMVFAKEDSKIRGYKVKFLKWSMHFDFNKS